MRFLLLLCLAGIAAAPPADETGDALSGDGTHTLALPSEAAGRRLVVRQLGIDVRVRARGPASDVVERDHDHEAWGVEVLRVPAGASVEVVAVPVSPASGQGRFRATVPSSAAGSLAVEALLDEAESRLVDADATRRREALQLIADADARARAEGDALAHALARHRLAAAHLRLGDARAAIAGWSEAREAWRAIGEAELATVALHQRLQARFAIGDLPGARADADTALAEWRALGSPAGEIELLDDRGVVVAGLGALAEARADHEVAIALARRTHDDRRRANAMANLAADQSREGEVNRAVATFDETLPLMRATGHRTGEATVLTNLAFLQLAMGDPRESVRRNLEVIALWSSLGNARGEAQAQQNLGGAYRALGDDANAVRAFEASLATVGQDDLWRAGTLLNLAFVERRRGQAAAARAHVDAVMRLLEPTGDPSQTSIALQLLAMLETDAGRPEAALPLLDRARAVGPPGLPAYDALVEIGRAERALGRLAEARTHLLEAVDRAEAYRSRLAVVDWRATMTGTTQRHYDLLAQVLVDLHRRQPDGGYAEEALSVVERARGRSLLDVLAEAHVDLRRGIDPDLLAQRRALQARLASALDAHLRLVTRGAPAGQVAEAAARASDVEAESDRLTARIRVASPAYAALAAPQPLAAEAIRRDLLDNDTMLIELALHDERSLLFTVTRDSVEVFDLPARSRIESAAARVHARWSAPADDDGSVEAFELSRLVLGPVATRLERRRLVVVADGTLLGLPIGALPDPDGSGRLLIDTHEVISAPSASTLAAQRAAGTRRPASRTLAIVADPVYAADDARVRVTRGTHVAHDVATPPRLAFSRREARAIAERVPPGQADLRLDFEASRDYARGPDAAGARILHFAAHGFLDQDRPRRSGIVLSMIDARGRPQEGLLSTADVFDLDLAAELVVLSGCRTGVGEVVGGEGLLGLTRAFMYAGASRVVASAWSVDDAATAELMTRFYEGMLKRGERPAAALRAAQLEVRATRRFRHPYYWAAFTLQGDWN